MSVPTPYGPLPVADHSDEGDWDDFRWMGRIPELSDFADIRDYADCCLQGNDPKGRWRTEVLSPDLDTLDGVLWQLDQDIPWFTEEQEKQAIDRIPDRPVVSPRPKGEPKKEWREKQERVKELQRYWDQNQRELKDRVELGKFIAETKKAHSIKKNAIARLRKQISDIQESGNDLPAVEQLNWIILPGGESAWPRVARCLEAMKRQHPSKKLEPSRLEKIWSLRPTRIFQGKNAFDGYFVCLFDRRAVLECPWVGNAIYVIRGDWRKLSRLSKSDLINRHRHEVRRIIHRESGNWFTEIKQAIS